MVQRTGSVVSDILTAPSPSDPSSAAHDSGDKRANVVGSRDDAAFVLSNDSTKRSFRSDASFVQSFVTAATQDETTQEHDGELSSSSSSCRSFRSSARNGGSVDTEPILPHDYDTADDGHVDRYGSDDSDADSLSDDDSSFESSDEDEDASLSSSGGWDSDLEEMESWMLKNEDPILRNGQFQMESTGLAEHARHASASRPTLRRNGSYNSLPSSMNLHRKQQQEMRQRHQCTHADRSTPTTTNAADAAFDRSSFVAPGAVVVTTDNAATVARKSSHGRHDPLGASNHSTRSEDFLRKLQQGVAFPPSYGSPAVTHPSPIVSAAPSSDKADGTSADVAANNSPNNDMYAGAKPEDYVREYVEAYGYKSLTDLQPNGRGSVDARAAAGQPNRQLKQQSPIYAQAAKAVRSGDLQMLHLIHREHGSSLCNCSNKYGESIVHIACRRGNYPILRYLMESVQTDIRVQDDYGRTPLHDAAWTETPNFDLVKLLLQRCPDLLFVKDVRGYLAVSYVPHCARAQWIQFLITNPELIEAGMDLP